MSPQRPAGLRAWRCWALGALAGWGAVAVQAAPGYYLVTAYDNAHEWSLDGRYWSVHPRGGHQRIWPEMGVGYGVSSRWHTEVFASQVGAHVNATRRESFNWQNDVLLTQGEYPFDLALHTLIAVQAGPRDGTLLEWGPVFQTDVGRWQINANAFLEHTVGAARGVPPQLKLQWQLKHRWSQRWHLGVQGFSELGPWRHWAPAAEQQHRVGPMLAGTWPLGGGPEWRYSAAWLQGRTYGRSGGMVSLRLQYVFR